MRTERTLDEDLVFPLRVCWKDQKVLKLSHFSENACKQQFNLPLTELVQNSKFPHMQIQFKEKTLGELLTLNPDFIKI